MPHDTGPASVRRLAHAILADTRLHLLTMASYAPLLRRMLPWHIPKPEQLNSLPAGGRTFPLFRFAKIG